MRRSLFPSTKMNRSVMGFSGFSLRSDVLLMVTPPIQPVRPCYQQYSIVLFLFSLRHSLCEGGSRTLTLHTTQRGASCHVKEARASILLTSIVHPNRPFPSFVAFRVGEVPGDLSPHFLCYHNLCMHVVHSEWQERQSVIHCLVSSFSVAVSLSMNVCR